MRTSFKPFNFSIENTPNFMESLKNRDVSVHFVIFLIDKKTLNTSGFLLRLNYIKNTRNNKVSSPGSVLCKKLQNY